MTVTEIFENYAADFEMTVQDDNWSRLGKYFSHDATYLNAGAPDPTIKGRDAILDYLYRDVSENDSIRDAHTLESLTPPAVEGNHSSRRWRCIYTVSGAQDLVLEGEARYTFEGPFLRLSKKKQPRSLCDLMISGCERMKASCMPSKSPEQTVHSSIATLPLYSSSSMLAQLKR